MSDLATHVSAAVDAMLSEPGALADVPPDRLGPAVHAALWPHVHAAVADALAARDLPAPAAPADRRARPWQYVARFWTADGDLVGETDPAVIHGTGELPGIVRALAAELHGDEALFSPEMDPDVLKGKLPQLRNNLGRADSAVLRIPYEILQPNGNRGESFVCQVDVYRLG